MDRYGALQEATGMFLGWLLRLMATGGACLETTLEGEPAAEVQEQEA